MPLNNSMTQIVMFLKFLFITGKYYSQTNELLRKVLAETISPEKLDTVLNLFYQLNDISKTIAACYGPFLLASIIAQFGIALNLSYNLFLILNGLIQFETFTFVSTILWIILQFVIVMACIVQSDKIHQEICRSLKMLTKFDSLRSKQLELLQIILIQGRPEFTAGKLFPINYGLMTMFFTSIVSYLIVIIQFHLQI